MTQRIFFAAIFSILVFCQIALPGEAIANTSAKTLIEASGIQAGLCVHLGATDGKLDAEFGRARKFLVHGLTIDQETSDNARAYIQGQQLYGQVAIERGNFSRLLYADNLVNLVIVENWQKLQQAGLKTEEIKRVLCPKGVLIIEASLKDELTKLGFDGIGSVGTDRVKAVKPRPKEMDEWTHSHHGPDSNAVSKDMLKPVNGVRWIAGPSYMTTASMIGVAITANGRLFQPIGAEESFLIARDAFNGMLLWKHPVKAWDGSRMNTQPASPSILVAQDNRVFVLLDKKPYCLDAATGKILKSYDKILSDCEEITYQNDSLILTSGKEVCCIDVKNDNLRWRHAMSPINLVLGEDKLFFQDISKKPSDIVSLDLNSGKQIWRKSMEQWGWNPGFSNHKNVALCLYQKGMLFLAVQKDAQKNAILHAISAKDGAPLWNFLHQGHYYGFADFKNVFFVDDLVWVHGGDAKVSQKVHNSYSVWYGLNPVTGKIEKEIEYTKNNKDFDRWRCDPDRVTARYFLIRSIGFLDRTDGVSRHFWGARNACGGSGIVPGNGLIYTSPHGCTCYSMIRGFLGLAFNGDFPRKTATPTDAERLQHGPLFGKMTGSSVPSPPSDNWPCFRHDIARSSRASSAVSQDAKLLWTLDVAKPAINPLTEEWAANPIVTGPITEATIAQGKVFLALPDANQVTAFDAQTQKISWQFTAGGRVDTPPTIHEGLCLFGSCDGWVYCLDARDGKLVWRFLAAPEDRRITVRGQLESIWPVFGSILVIKDVAYFSAGRSNASDGGIVIYAVEPKTGKMLWKIPFFVPLSSCVVNDLLISDGEFLYLRSKRFDLKTGQMMEMYSESKFYDAKVICSGATDMLDASWRTFGPMLLNLLPLKYYGSFIKLGELLAIGDDQIYGFHLSNWGGQPKPSLFAWKKGKDFRPPASTNINTWGFDAGSKAWGQWSVEVPLPTLVETMLVDGNTLWVAGATDRIQRKEGFLWALSKTDGKILNKWKLAAPPIYEGLSAANGRLYLSTQDGKLLCFGK